MSYIEFSETDENHYAELVQQINSESVYKAIETSEKKWMSVPEMGKMLGLRKTERYWLVKKGFFISKRYKDSIRINIESFENWYAGQLRYHKINGEEPGKNLRIKYFTLSDIEKLLGVSHWVSLYILENVDLVTITMECWTLVEKESFWKWYHSQSHYRIKEQKNQDSDIESSSLTMPEMARMLGITRQTVYNILNSKKYSGIFELIVVGDKKHITKDSFEKFLQYQHKYKLASANNEKDISSEQDCSPPSQQKDQVPNYLTIKEASTIAGVSVSSIYKWLDNGYIKAVTAGRLIRLNRSEFEKWLVNHRNEVADKKITKSTQQKG